MPTIAPINVLKCPEGQLHDLTYLGKGAQAYRCRKCGIRILKGDLSKVDDA